MNISDIAFASIELALYIRPVHLEVKSTILKFHDKGHSAVDSAEFAQSEVRLFLCKIRSRPLAQNPEKMSFCIL